MQSSGSDDSDGQQPAICVQNAGPALCREAPGHGMDRLEIAPMGQPVASLVSDDNDRQMPDEVG